MTNKEVLYKKFIILCHEIKNAETIVTGEEIECLERLNNQVDKLINMLLCDSLPKKRGGLLGVLRCISEYDSLSAIHELYDAAYDVESYYSFEFSD